MTGEIVSSHDLLNHIYIYLLWTRGQHEVRNKTAEQISIYNQSSEVHAS